MGKYSIGARVRNGGDEGTITAKRKGDRRVVFDGYGNGEGTWWGKDELEPVVSATVTVGVRPEKVANEFSIEVGKTYRTSDGRKAGPLLEGEQFSFGGPWFFKFGDNYFKKDGKSCFGRNGHNNRPADDLVAEWVEPAPVAADIQIGDKVDYWLDGRKHGSWTGSVINRLPDESRPLYGARHAEYGDGAFRTDWIKPSPVRAGDRVRYVNGGDFVAKRLLGLKGFVRSITDDTAHVALDDGAYHTCLIENLRAIGDASVALAKAA